MYELKSIQPILHYTNKEGRTYSRISISHKSMVEDLRKLGIVKRKSLILKFPNFIEENLIRHFIRGYFDGDGSICYGKTTKNVHFSIVSTKKFLDKIKCILSKNIDLYSGIYDIKSLKNKSNKSTKRLAITGWNKVNIIMTWLYKDSNIFLDRKHRKFREITKLKSAQSA